MNISVIDLKGLTETITRDPKDIDVGIQLINVGIQLIDDRTNHFISLQCSCFQLALSSVAEIGCVGGDELIIRGSFLLDNKHLASIRLSTGAMCFNHSIVPSTSIVQLYVFWVVLVLSLCFVLPIMMRQTPLEVLIRIQFGETDFVPLP